MSYALVNNITSEVLFDVFLSEYIEGLTNNERLLFVGKYILGMTNSEMAIHLPSVAKAENVFFLKPDIYSIMYRSKKIKNDFILRYKRWK